MKQLMQLAADECPFLCMSVGVFYHDGGRSPLFLDDRATAVASAILKHSGPLIRSSSTKKKVVNGTKFFRVTWKSPARACVEDRAVKNIVVLAVKASL